MHTATRLVAVLLAAAVWIYAAMALAPGRLAHEGRLSSVMDAVDCTTAAAVD